MSKGHGNEMDKDTFESIMRGARQALAWVQARFGSDPQQHAATVDVVEHKCACEDHSRHYATMAADRMREREANVWTEACADDFNLPDDALNGDDV